jgi:hypothetical protein
MTQRLSEGIQHKLLMKLLEFDYSIEYKKGKDNAVAYALSRRDHDLAAISIATPSWIAEIEESYKDDPHYTNLLQQLTVDSQSVQHYSLHSGILRFKGRIYVGNANGLRSKILSSLYSSAIGGHSGMKATYQRVRRIFQWPNMKKQVEEFVVACATCQRNKAEHYHYPRLLAPLPIPDIAWSFISWTL